MPATGAFGYTASKLWPKGLELRARLANFQDDWGAYVDDEETLTELSQLRRENRELEKEIEQLDNEDPAHPVVAATLRERELYNERGKTWEARQTIKQQAARIAELEADLIEVKEKLRNLERLRGDKGDQPLIAPNPDYEALTHRVSELTEASAVLQANVKTLEAKGTANESLAKQVNTMTNTNFGVPGEPSNANTAGRGHGRSAGAADFPAQGQGRGRGRTLGSDMTLPSRGTEWEADLSRSRPE